ncbi:hypothetical protein M2350_001135 [Candidatus Fervidibacter sacchari]|uniref:Uncharacterized protein n=1 Tax=Candidatus Fervidibacter sacchari TaxID=1448929 RepID=A0ABT2ELK6_9BACT|nr:hypothetical protein [Candidatus Fervidibacter sacchari]
MASSNFDNPPKVGATKSKQAKACQLSCGLSVES